MSSIAGIYRKSGQVVSAEEMTGMMDALDHWQADRRDQLTDGPVGLGHLLLFNTPESRHEQLPWKDPESGLIITADARIDNRRELMGKLSVQDAADQPVTDSRLILEAYKQFGTSCTDHLTGAFAFAIHDPQKGQLFCARDHMGFKPFYYLEQGDLFLFATEIRGIKAHPEANLSVNKVFIADALSTLRSEKDRTFFNEIFRLPPAHQMIVSGKKASLTRYWNLDPHHELKLPSDKDYINLFLEYLREAVRCRLRSAYPVGAELSGGVDSSAIVGLAAREGPVKAFSHALPDWARDKYFPYDDETRHSKTVTEYHRIKDHFLITGENESLLDQLREGLRLHEGVMQGTLSEVFDPLYRKAQKEGCRTLLSGYGGDEMVTSPGPGYYQELAAAFKLLRLYRELQNKNRDKGTLKVLKSFIKNLLYGQLQHFRPAYKTPGWAHDIYHALAISPGFMKEVGLKERFYQKKRLPASGSTRMQQYRRINYDYVPQRLEYCAIKAQTHRIEYRYPLLDRRLVEFYLSLPARLKVNNGYGRYILRKALEGILPPEIQWRTDKTGTVVPSVFMRWKQEEKAIRELIRQARESNIRHYVAYDGMLEMLERMLRYDKNTTERINPQAFQSSLMLLMYQLDKKGKDGPAATP